MNMRSATFLLLAGCSGSDVFGAGSPPGNPAVTSGGGQSTSTDVSVGVGVGGGAATSGGGDTATAGVGGDPATVASSSSVSSSSSGANTSSASSSGSGGDASAATKKYCTDTDPKDVANNCDVTHANCACVPAVGPCGPTDNPQMPPTNCSVKAPWCCSFVETSTCWIYTAGGTCQDPNGCGYFKGESKNKIAYFCMKPL